LGQAQFSRQGANSLLCLALKFDLLPYALEHILVYLYEKNRAYEKKTLTQSPSTTPKILTDAKQTNLSSYFKK